MRPPTRRTASSGAACTWTWAGAAGSASRRRSPRARSSASSPRRGRLPRRLASCSSRRRQPGWLIRPPTSRALTGGGQPAHRGQIRRPHSRGCHQHHAQWGQQAPGPHGGGSCTGHARSGRSAAWRRYVHLARVRHREAYAGQKPGPAVSASDPSRNAQQARLWTAHDRRSRNPASGTARLPDDLRAGRLARLEVWILAPCRRRRHPWLIRGTIAAARNAQDLLNDAQVLAEAGCPARAYSLAALAVEEAGKASSLSILTMMPEDLRARAPVGRMLEWHQLKQAAGLFIAAVPCRIQEIAPTLA